MTVDPHVLSDQIHRLGDMEKRVIGHLLHRKAIAQDANLTYEQSMTFGERVADRVAAFGGSWTFIFLFLAIMVVWMGINVAGAAKFDAYPFILLNLVLSCVAAMQAPVIMMSQNRQSDKDRLNAKLDYEVNLKAEMEIMGLHAKIDELRLQQMNELVELHKRQMELIQQLEAKLQQKPV